jgi:hypothetical protein
MAMPPGISRYNANSGTAIPWTSATPGFCAKRISCPVHARNASYRLEVRLMTTDLLRSQVCRSSEEVLNVHEQSKAAMQAKRLGMIATIGR